MAYYQLCGSGQSAEYLHKRKIITASINPGSNGLQYVILLLENGRVDLFELGALSLAGHLDLYADKTPLKNILSVSACGTLNVLQTFKQLYLVDWKVILECWLMHKVTHFEAEPLICTQSQSHFNEDIQKMTNKQVKLIKYQQRLGLKLAGRLKQELQYYFCTIQVNGLVVHEVYSSRFKHEYRISIDSLNKDFIIYQSYVNKFKPIRLQVISYMSHYESKDTEMAQKFEVYQFQQRCCISNVKKIGSDIVCLFTNTHFQNTSQSNIILYHTRQKYIIANVLLKDFLLFSAVVSGDTIHQQLTYGNVHLMIECIGHEDNRIGVRQVFPLTAMQSPSNFLPTSDHYSIHPNTILLVSTHSQSIQTYPKVSKKAIYYHWLREEFGVASSLFGSILALL